MSFSRFDSFIYVISKSIIEKLFGKKIYRNHKFFKALTLILSALLLTLLAFILTPFVAFKLIVYLILKIIYKNNFGGFIGGLGSAFKLTDEKCLMSCVITIEDNEITSFSDKFKLLVKKTHESVDELRCIQMCFMGFYFHVKNQVKYEEIYEETTINDKLTITEDELLNYVTKRKVYNQKHLYLWEVKFINQPIVYGSEQKKKYGVIVSIDHAVGDGYSALLLLKNHLFDEIVEIPLSLNTKSEKINLDDLYWKRNVDIDQNDLLPGSTRQYLVASYDENREYLQKVKNIRRKYNVAFMDVIAVALNAAVVKFLRNKFGKYPRKLFNSFTYRTQPDETRVLTSGIKSKIKMRNKTSAFTILIPTIDDDLTSSLKIVSRERKEQKSAIDIGLFFMAYVCPFLPIAVLKRILFKELPNYFIIFSNFAALPQATVCNRKVIDVSGTLNLVAHNRGLVLQLASYDGRLQMSLSGRQEFLDSQKELKSILYETLEIIDQLHYQ